MVNDRLLHKIPAVCEQLGMSRSKVYELIRSGKLKSVGEGGCRRVAGIDLLDYVDRLRSMDRAS